MKKQINYFDFKFNYISYTYTLFGEQTVQIIDSIINTI